MNACIYYLGNGCYKRNVDYLGNDLNDGYRTLTDSAKDCQILCEKHPACVAFSWISANVPEGPFMERKRECWLKHTIPPGVPQKHIISGPKRCSKFSLDDGHYCSIISYDLVFWHETLTS